MNRTQDRVTPTAVKIGQYELSSRLFVGTGKYKDIAETEAALLRQQVIDYWALPWHAPLAGAVERVAAVGLHISLSMLVWMAVSRRKVILYFAAVLYHAAVNALATIALSFNLNVWFIEAALLLVSFGVLWMVYRRAKQVDEERKRADAAQAQVEIKPE